MKATALRILSVVPFFVLSRLESPLFFSFGGARI